MSIISQETFEKFTEEEKNKVREKYRYEFMEGSELDAILLVDIFGKENLQPKPKIKTWDDLCKQGYYVGANDDKDIRRIDLFANNVDDKIKNKILATLKIAKLIELGYGGIVTDEEWKDENAEKWSVLNNHNFGDFDIVKMTIGYGWKSFISFHTKEQADEFMSYPENVKLVMQYYMV